MPENKKGSFPYDRELGSELHTLTESVQPLGETAALLVKEAAAQIPQVKILDVEASFDNEKSLASLFYWNLAGNRAVWR